MPTDYLDFRPYPELVEDDDFDSPWNVFDANRMKVDGMSPGMSDIGRRRMVVPFDEWGEYIGIHEQAHVRWSPKEIPRVRFPNMLLQAVEDARINLGCQSIGVMPKEFPQDMWEFFSSIFEKEYENEDYMGIVVRAVATIGTPGEADSLETVRALPRPWSTLGRDWMKRFRREFSEEAAKHGKPVARFSTVKRLGAIFADEIAEVQEFDEKRIAFAMKSEAEAKEGPLPGGTPVKGLIGGKSLRDSDIHKPDSHGDLEAVMSSSPIAHAELSDIEDEKADTRTPKASTKDGSILPDEGGMGFTKVAREEAEKRKAEIERLMALAPDEKPKPPALDGKKKKRKKGEGKPKIKLSEEAAEAEKAFRKNGGSFVSKKPVAFVGKTFYAKKKIIEEHRDTPDTMTERMGFMRRHIPEHEVESETELDRLAIKCHELKEEAELNSGVMKLVRFPLTVPNARVLKGKSMKPACSDTGTIIRRPDRLLIDRQIFARRRPRPGCTVVVDVSGSMSLPGDAVEQIIIAAGGSATVAHYCGSEGMGELCIVAQDERRATFESIAHRVGCGNIVDVPALQWLATQPGPRIWVCDGGVTGNFDNGYREIDEYCAAFTKQHGIVRYGTANSAITALERMGRGAI